MSILASSGHSCKTIDPEDSAGSAEDFKSQ